MIRKGIKNPRDFFQKNVHGWINFLQVASLMHSENLNPEPHQYTGGASGFLQFGHRIKGGVLTISMLQIH